MQNIQETYNEFLKIKYQCKRCDKEFHFSQVIQWGSFDGGAENATCPFCSTHMRIDVPAILKIIEQLGDMDRRIANIIVAYADSGGQFHGHPPYQEIYFKCAMVMKYCYNFQTILKVRPLSYIDRMVLVQIYQELLREGKVEEINIYEVKAPIPVVIERPKVASVTHYPTTEQYKNKKKQGHHHKPKSSGGSIKMSFGFGGSKSKDVDTSDLDKLLDDFNKGVGIE